MHAVTMKRHLDTCAQSTELELKYKSCYARILDAKRRFLEAAQRYYDLSQAPSSSDAGTQVPPPS